MENSQVVTTSLKILSELFEKIYVIFIELRIKGDPFARLKGK